VASGEEAVVGTGWQKMKLKFLFVVLAIALVQIAQLNAQSVSPAGHYTKKRGGVG
jgi:hypothetical protein